MVYYSSTYDDGIINRDGSRPIIDFTTQKKITAIEQSPPVPPLNLSGNFVNIHSPLINSKGYYPGLPGLLHSSNTKEIPLNSPLGEFLGELSITQLQALAFMFNYQSETIFLGPNRVCVQMDESDWSSPFSLDNLEINQTISADHMNKGALELGQVKS